MYIVSLGKCMMSVKHIAGSLVITILPHLGDIMPSGGGLSGRVFFQRGYLPTFIYSIQFGSRNHLIVLCL